MFDPINSFETIPYMLEPSTPNFNSNSIIVRRVCDDYVVLIPNPIVYDFSLHKSLFPN